MDTLADKYLGHKTISFTDIAGKGKNQLTFNQVALDLAANYSAEDADITLRLHEVLHPRVAADAALNKVRSEEHTSELQSLMRISYAVFCLKKKKKNKEDI